MVLPSMDSSPSQSGWVKLRPTRILFGQRKRLVGHCRRVLRIQRDRAIEARVRLVVSAESQMDDAQIAVGFSVARIELQRAVVIDQRLLEPHRPLEAKAAYLVERHATR